MRPSNDEHTETLAAENAKVEALNAKVEALTAEKKALTAEKKALNAKEEALNAKEEALKDALVACVTKIGGDTDTAQFGIYNGSDTTANALKDALKELKDSLKDKKKSLNAQLESLNVQLESLNVQLQSLNAQLEEVQKRLTLRAQAPPQDGLVEKVDFLVAQAKKTEENRRRDEVRDIQASLLHRGDSVGSSKTTGGSHNLQYNTIVQGFGGMPLRCMVCGKVSEKSGDVTVAHILKTEEACRKFGVTWIHENDLSNWLALCGKFSTEYEQTCHYKFDAKTMGFVHDNSEENPLNWKVVEHIGEQDGSKKLKVTRVVELKKSNPHRCILHAHMEEVCQRAKIHDWLADLPEIASFTPRKDRVELLDSAALPFIPIANASSHSSSTTSVTPTRAEFATDP
ncbi:hypothetical protein DIPPA_14020 [Diplonema papillatum]|nr:hypothetical protein DIPPA_14020 [Diplonema papillatum]